jgi:CubicO group peptidase (beta-lactamase class C family)
MKIPHYIQCLLHSFLVLFMFTFSIPTVSAAPAETDDYALLDSFITAQMDKHRIPGVALAVVIQNVSGTLYEEYIQKYTLEPLGMTRTYTDPELARQNGLSQGYSRLFGFVAPQNQPHRIFEVTVST